MEHRTLRAPHNGVFFVIVPLFEVFFSWFFEFSEHDTHLVPVLCSRRLKMLNSCHCVGGCATNQVELVRHRSTIVPFRFVNEEGKRKTISSNFGFVCSALGHRSFLRLYTFECGPCSFA